LGFCTEKRLIFGFLAGINGGGEMSFTTVFRADESQSIPEKVPQ